VEGQAKSTSPQRHLGKTCFPVPTGSFLALPMYFHKVADFVALYFVPFWSANSPGLNAISGVEVGIEGFFLQ
jgi:hypothetical protein